MTSNLAQDIGVGNRFAAVFADSLIQIKKGSDRREICVSFSIGCRVFLKLFRGAVDGRICHLEALKR
jgi:hypothetical protein